MKKKLALMLVLAFLMSLLAVPVALSEDSAPTPAESAVTTEPAPADSSPVVIQAPLSDVEASTPAPDIALSDANATPAPAQGSVDAAVQAAKDLDAAIPKAGVTKDFATLKNNAANPDALVKLARRARTVAITYRTQLHKSPKAKKSLILFTDQLVRLASRPAIKPAVRLTVFRNAMQTYAVLGAYKRAAGVAKLIAVKGKDKTAERDLKTLLNKLQGRLKNTSQVQPEKPLVKITAAKKQLKNVKNKRGVGKEAPLAADAPSAEPTPSPGAPAEAPQPAAPQQ